MTPAPCEGCRGHATHQNRDRAADAHGAWWCDSCDPAVTPERAREIIAAAQASEHAGPWVEAIDRVASSQELDAIWNGAGAPAGESSFVDALFRLARADWPDLVVLDSGEIALVVTRRAPGAFAPHVCRRWSERLGRLLEPQGIGVARFRALPALDDPRVQAIRAWMKGAMGT